MTPIHTRRPQGRVDTVTRRRWFRLRLHLLAATLASLSGALAAQDATTTSARAPTELAQMDAERWRPMGLLANLGHWQRVVTTREVQAQDFFDRGLRLYHAANFEHAFRAFKEAQRVDPDCVMCVWGAAMAVGPHLGTSMGKEAERQAIRLSRRGLLLLNRVGADERERGLMRAVAVRHLDLVGHTRAGRDSAYAGAMAKLARHHPDDADILTLAAESAMMLSPLQYWSRDSTLRPGTERVVTWLHAALRLAPDHPGACHLAVHVFESVQPALTPPCADAAIRAHHHHALSWAAVMAGASAPAITSARRLTQLLSPAIVRRSPSLEPLLATVVQTLVAFGRWDDVLRSPLPPSDLRVARAYFWYGRGMAFAAKGRTIEARATIDSIRAVSRRLPDGNARQTLRVAELVLDGEVAFRQGDTRRAMALLTEAVDREDRLMMVVPPVWQRPARQSLARVQLDAGRVSDAVQTYEADLARWPMNGWSLRGLATALRLQGRQDEADAVDKRIAVAWRPAGQ